MAEEESKETLSPGIPPEPEIDPTIPPDGGYAWVCAFAMLLINGWTWGILSSYGVYLSYYISNHTFEGANDLDFTFVGGTNFACAFLCAPLINIICRRYGTKPPMYLGCFLIAGGFVSASFSTQFWHLILTQGMLVGLGVGFVWLPSSPILAQWFWKRRSLAQGIASSGSGIAGVIFSSATTPMIQHISLAWSLRITGIISFIVLFVATILIKDRNAIIRPRIHPFDTNLLGKYQVLLMVGFSAFSVFGYIVLLYSLSAFALTIGLTQHQGGIIVTILNLGTAFGRPSIGVLSDRYGRITMACILTGVNIIMCFAVWIPLNSYGLLIFFAIIVGITSGVYWPVIAPLCAEVVDLKDLPSMLGLMWLTVSLPSLFSEAIALALRRPNQSKPYLYPQIYTGLTFLIATAFLVELRRVKLGFRAKERHN